MTSDSATDRIKALLPTLTSDEQAFVDRLPPQYSLPDVPYVTQGEKHWSGAACAQMLLAFFGREQPDQGALVAKVPAWREWSTFTHESLAEEMVRLMASLNLAPANYYPGRYVLPSFSTGVEGADFISSNHELFSQIDFLYFRALFVASNAPVYIRVHFDTDEYPMDENMATRLDTAGHGLLIVGYDSEGFLVHDPWDRAKWGGPRGGPYMHMSYDRLKTIPAVNCCQEQLMVFSPLRVRIPPPRVAIHENREINVDIEASLPGIKSLLGDTYPLKITDVTLDVAEGLGAESELRQTEVGTILPGGTSRTSFTLTTGKTPGSYRVDARVTAILHVPAFPWESGATPADFQITGHGHRRIDVKSREWLNLYGRRPD